MYKPNLMNTRLHLPKVDSILSSCLFTLALMLMIQNWGNAQTFPGSATNTAGNNQIPSTGTEVVVWNHKLQSPVVQNSIVTLQVDHSKTIECLTQF
jgi:hypothetical protein